MEVAGPLAVVQLLETSLLCLVNYARYTHAHFPCIMLKIALIMLRVILTHTV